MWWTIAILVADSILGSVLMRSPGPRGVAALQRGDAAGPRAGARGARRRAGDLRRRAAAHAGLHHRHPRADAADPADPRARARGAGAAARAPDGACGTTAAASAAGRDYDVEGTAVDVDAAHARTALTDARPSAPGDRPAGLRRRGDVRVRRSGAGALRAGAPRAAGADGDRGQRAGVLFAGASRSPCGARRRPGRREAGSSGSRCPGWRRPSRSRCAAGPCASTTASQRLRAEFEPPGRRPRSRRRGGGRGPAAWSGYEQLCHVHGHGAARRADARGALPRPARPLVGRRRTGSGSRPTRTLAPGSTTAPASCCTAVRPAGAERPRAARRLGRGASAPRAALRVDEPRLSTTYDEEGRQQRAGARAVGRRGRRVPAARGRRGGVRLDARARRSSGSTARSCAGAWTGATGIGRYDLLRRA